MNNESKCKDGKCQHKKCACGHCKNYHVWWGSCTQINLDLTTCNCKKFQDKVNSRTLKKLDHLIKKALANTPTE